MRQNTNISEIVFLRTNEIKLVHPPMSLFPPLKLIPSSSLKNPSSSRLPSFLPSLSVSLSSFLSLSLPSYFDSRMTEETFSVGFFSVLCSDAVTPPRPAPALPPACPPAPVYIMCRADRGTEMGPRLPPASPELGPASVPLWLTPLVQIEFSSSFARSLERGRKTNRREMTERRAFYIAFPFGKGGGEGEKERKRRRQFG